MFGHWTFVAANRFVWFGLLFVALVPVRPALAQKDLVSGVIDVLQVGDQRFGLRRSAGIFQTHDDELGSFRSGRLSHGRFFPGHPSSFERIFPDKSNPDNVFLVARERSTGPESRMIYTLNKKRQFQSGVITQELDDASYYQTKSGALFIYSRDGRIVRFADGLLEHFDLPMDAELASKRGKLREIKCVESPEGIVAFYSIVDPALARKALTDLVWYDEGWQTISLKGRRTGPGFFAGPKSFRIIGPGKVMTIDLQSKSISESDTPPIELNGKMVQLRPVDVLIDPDNKPLVLLRHYYRSRLRYDVDAFAGGKFLLGATLNTQGEQFVWDSADVTFDYELYRSRFSNVDGHGNWWITGGGGIWRRTPEGVWSEFGFRYGLNPPTKITHTKIDQQNRLWMMNFNRTSSRASVIDLDLIGTDAADALSPRWNLVSQQVPLQRNQNGALFSVDRQNNICFWGPQGLRRVALPVDAENEIHFNFRKDKVTIDETQAWWLRESSDKAWRFQDGQWSEVARSDAPANLTNPEEEESEAEPQVAPAAGSKPSQRCPIVESEARYTIGRPIRLVRGTDRVTVASPDGNWQTHVIDNEIKRTWLLGRYVKADNHGRLFVEKDAYYKPLASTIWFEPQRVDASADQEDLGSVDAPNRELNPKWKVSQESGQEIKEFSEHALYQWCVDDGPWSRWLTLDTRPVIYALPEKGQHELQVRLNVPGVFVRNGTIKYRFATEYDFSETVNPLLKQLDSDSFDERKRAAEELLSFGIGVLPSLNEIVETGSPEARVSAKKLVELIETSQTDDNQHSFPK